VTLRRPSTFQRRRKRRRRSKRAAAKPLVADRGPKVP
jgi:hypothetical protein